MRQPLRQQRRPARQQRGPVLLQQRQHGCGRCIRHQHHRAATHQVGEHATAQRVHQVQRLGQMQHVVGAHPGVAGLGAGRGQQPAVGEGGEPRCRPGDAGRVGGHRVGRVGGCAAGGAKHCHIIGQHPAAQRRQAPGLQRRGRQRLQAVQTAAVHGDHMAQPGQMRRHAVQAGHHVAAGVRGQREHHPRLGIGQTGVQDVVVGLQVEPQHGHANLGRGVEQHHPIQLVARQDGDAVAALQRQAHQAAGQLVAGNVQRLPAAGVAAVDQRGGLGPLTASVCQDVTDGGGDHRRRHRQRGRAGCRLGVAHVQD